jgi:OHCU decarboxylase
MPEEGIARLNALSPAEAEKRLLECCGSTNWARRMAAQRPFRATREILEAADRIWWDLGREDWLEAFDRHPKIGERSAARTAPEQTRRWSEQEQAGAARAPGDVLATLADANRAYQARFGYIFIVCAAGKSGEEMLALLRARLQNDPSSELRIAAEEQRKITRLRLEKLLRGSEAGAGR